MPAFIEAAVGLVVHAFVAIVEWWDETRNGNPLKKGVQRSQQDERRIDALRRTFRLRK